MTIGDIIYDYRKTNKISLVTFSKKCGLSKSYLSALEHGNVTGRKGVIKPSMDAYRKLANAMYIPLEQLLDMVDELDTNSVEIEWSAEEREVLESVKRYLLWKREH